MGTYNPMITQMIQDAVLKLCTQNIMFQKSLEIDGIICVSSGEEQRDIVVKMHRTIVKPEVAPTPVESWSSSIESDWQNTVNTNTPRNTSFDSYDSSTPIGNRRSESRPGHRGPYKSKHTVVNEPPKRTFNEVHEPPEPTATLETPGGLDIDSDYSVTNIKAEPDTSPNSKRKNSDSNLDQNEEVPAKLPKYNIKEEAITIELNDEDDDDGGEGDTETAGASWMGAEGDDTTRTFDNINMDSMNNTYASADTGDESQMHDAGGAMQGAGGDMGDQSDGDYQSLFTCLLCGAMFQSANIFTEHCMRVHTRERLHTGEKTPSTGEENVHPHTREDSHHKEISSKPYKCGLCKESYWSEKSNLDRHMRLTHGTQLAKYMLRLTDTGYVQMKTKLKEKKPREKKFECETCHKMFESDYHLKVHIRNHTGERPFKCDICDKTFIQKCAMRAHARNVHLIKQSDFRPHKYNGIRVTSRQPRVECPKCHEMFHGKRELSNHLPVHTGERVKSEQKPNHQEQTHEGQINEQQDHALQAHKEQISELQMNEGQTCKEQRNKLQIHEQNVHEQQMNEQNKSKDLLKRPKKIKVKNVDCEICGKKFHSKANLIIHIRIHTGEKPFKCSVCDMTFAQKSAVRAHMRRIHKVKQLDFRPRKTYRPMTRAPRKRKKVKNIFCAICSKGFECKSVLIKHMVVHTGERPFTCDVCSSTFTQKSGMTNHKRKYHSDQKKIEDKVSTLTLSPKLETVSIDQKL